MAKVKITGHASGTGVVTVTAPNTSTDRTITLPDTTGTLLASEGAVVINESGVDANFRVESGTNGNMLVVDAGEDRVGIGASAPAQLLEISGGNNLDTGAVVRLSSSSNDYSEWATKDTTTRIQHVENSADAGNGYGVMQFKTNAASTATSTRGGFKFTLGSGDTLVMTNDGRGLSQFTAKAWVNFNGTGTLAVRDSHNVASVTDNGTGEWSVTYTNSMANANYSATTANAYVGSTYNITYAMISGYSTSSIQFYTQGEGAGLRDVTTMNLQVFGD